MSRLARSFRLSSIDHWHYLSPREELQGSWAGEIERMAAGGAAVVHLANWKIRRASQLPVMRAILARTVRQRGGREALSEGERF